MISYQVQKGDTIAQVTKQLNSDWQTIKRQNPDAVGRLKNNGNWFLREGATIKIEGSFAASLQNAVKEQSTNLETIATASKGPLVGQTFLENCTSETEPGQIIEHTLQPGETIWDLAVNKYHVNIDDIIEENDVVDPTTLQIGQTLRIPLPKKGTVEQVVASWYGESFHGKKMANGQVFDMYGTTIAHKEIPLGTTVELTNVQTGERVMATVADRGPYVHGRDIDLSYGLAKQLSLIESGVGTLEMRIL